MKATSPTVDPDESACSIFLVLLTEAHSGLAAAHNMSACGNQFCCCILLSSCSTPRRIQPNGHAGRGHVSTLHRHQMQRRTAGADNGGYHLAGVPHLHTGCRTTSPEPSRRFRVLTQSSRGVMQHRRRRGASGPCKSREDAAERRQPASGVCGGQFLKPLPPPLWPMWGASTAAMLSPPAERAARSTRICCMR